MSDSTPSSALDQAQAYLARHELQYERNGDLIVVPVPIGGDSREIARASLRSNADTRGLAAQIVSSRRIETGDLPKASLVCNQWNRTHMAPRAVLVPLAEDPEASTVVLDGWLPGAGVSQEQVDLFLAAVLRGTRAFWGNSDVGTPADGDGPFAGS